MPVANQIIIKEIIANNAGQALLIKQLGSGSSVKVVKEGSGRTAVDVQGGDLDVGGGVGCITTQGEIHIHGLGTMDDANTESLEMGWDSDNSKYFIGVHKAGTGSYRNLVLQNNGADIITISSGGSVGMGVSPTSKLDLITGSVGTTWTGSANSIRIRHVSTSGNAMVLSMGVSTSAKGGSNNGHGYIQAWYWGASNNQPLLLQPVDGAVCVGDVPVASDWRFAVLNKIAVRGTTASGGNTPMGRLIFAHAGNYLGESAYISGIYDQTLFSQGVGIVFYTVSGSDISSTSGVERMRIASDGKVTITNGTATVVPLVIKAAVSQSANLQEWQNSSAVMMSGVGPKGSFLPASLADSDAPNNSIYYSTTASKLVYKDSDGVVNVLY